MHRFRLWVSQCDDPQNRGLRPTTRTAPFNFSFFSSLLLALYAFKSMSMPYHLYAYVLDIILNKSCLIQWVYKSLNIMLHFIYVMLINFVEIIIIIILQTKSILLLINLKICNKKQDYANQLYIQIWCI